MARVLSSVASPPHAPLQSSQPPPSPHPKQQFPTQRLPPKSSPLHLPPAAQPPLPLSPSPPVPPSSVPAVSDDSIDVAGLVPFIAGTAACMLVFFAVGFLISFVLRSRRLLAAVLPSSFLVILVGDVDNPDGTTGRPAATSQGDEKSRGLDPATLATFPIVTFCGLAGGSSDGRGDERASHNDKENGHDGSSVCEEPVRYQPVRYALPLGEEPVPCFSNPSAELSKTELPGGKSELLGNRTLGAGAAARDDGEAATGIGAGNGAGHEMAADVGATDMEKQGTARGSGETEKTADVPEERAGAAGCYERGGMEYGEEGGLECAVCLSEFEDGELLRCLPPCGHRFHVSCIDAWLLSHTSCPTCRSSLQPQSGNDVTTAEGIVTTEDDNAADGNVAITVNDSTVAEGGGERQP